MTRMGAAWADRTGRKGKGQKKEKDRTGHCMAQHRIAPLSRVQTAWLAAQQSGPAGCVL